MMEYKYLSDAVVDCREKSIAGLTREAVRSRGDVQEIMEKGFMNGMSIVEKKMRNGKMYIPEVLMAARTAKLGMETLIRSSKARELTLKKGTAVIGSVKGDLQHFGKTIVAMMCESTGLEVIDIGKDRSPEHFIDSTRRHQADIICLASFFPANLPSAKAEMEAMVSAIMAHNFEKKVKILIASEWISQSFSQSIGAHAHAPTAVTAAQKVRSMLSD